MNTLPLTARQHDGEGGVVLDGATTTDGKRLIADSFYDLNAGQRCEPEMMSDCRLHCVPSAGFVVLLHADAACSHPLVAMEASCDTAPAPLVKTAMYASVHCGGVVTQVFRTGGPASLVKGYIGLECEGRMEMTGRTWFEAEEIPPSAFPVVTDATE